MKKIIIVNNNMHIGGVQKSLVNLLVNICDKYDITVLLFHPAGELMKEIPQNVKLLTVSSLYKYLGMIREDVVHFSVTKLVRGVFALITKILGRDKAISIMALTQNNLEGYDIAISYLHNAGDKMFYGGCNDFVVRHIQAKKKITFLHCDYSKCGAATKKNNHIYEKFDQIVACSDGCKNSFLKVIPNLEEKTKTVPNFHDFTKIKKMADLDDVNFPKDRLNIVTVARLGNEKGVPRAIEAFGKIKMKNYCYYIIGEGVERPIIEQLVKEYGLQGQIVLVGELKNPYGYMKAADILLIPSVSEAAPMVIDEAASLGTPILSTETASANEMILNRGYGWVCENSIEGLRKSLEEILKNPYEFIIKCSDLVNKDVTNDLANERLEQILCLD